MSAIKGDVNPDDVEAAPAAGVNTAPVAQSQQAEVSAETAVAPAPVASAPAQMNEAQLQDKLDQLFPETATVGQPENLVPQSGK